jgi:hypothetical protein
MYRAQHEEPAMTTVRHAPNAKANAELRTANKVAEAIAAFYSTIGYDVACSDLFAADHTHEQLAPGGASVAWEGGVEDWVFNWPRTNAGKSWGAKLGVWFEPVNACTLAIYPVN